MPRTTVNVHIKRGDGIAVEMDDPRWLVLRVGSDVVLDDLVVFAEPAVMVALLDAALSAAQHLLDPKDGQHDASRPGPGTRSVRRSVLGAGASGASPEPPMAEGG